MHTTTGEHMTKDEALKLALVALENAVRYHGIMLMADPPQAAWKYHRVEDNAKQAITALREALAQPVQEPVAWTTMPEADDWDFVSGNKDPTGKLEGKWFPLYTTPPAAQRKPLTEEDLRKLADKHLFYQPEGYEVSGIYNLARAIEAAHGIKEQS